MAGLSFQVDNTLGAAFIGFSFSTFALGIVVAQIYRYYRRFPLDRLPYKILVAGLAVLEVLHQILITHAVYYYLVSNFANPIALIGRPVIWSIILQAAFGALSGCIVKACFAMRVWRFSNRNIYVTGIVLLLTLVQLCFASVYAAQGFAFAFQGLQVASARPAMKLWATLSLGVGAAADVITAAALSFYLRRLRTGYKRSDNIVTRLTIFAINTGVLTSSFSLATVILYNFMPENFVFMGVYFVLSKLYAISLLAALNTRQIVRGRGTDEQGNTDHPHTFHMVHSPSTQRGRQVPCLSTSNELESGTHQLESKVSHISDLPDYTLAW